MTSERSIPHLRDIFGLNSYTSSHNQNSNNPNSVIDPYNGHQQQDKKQSRKKRENSKTLTGDVKTLERHLSMKKTIRKKIMRDLQQAFVDDPNEFKVETSNSEHLKAELNLEALRFGENPSKKSDNFLVMLRGDQKGNGYDYSSNSAQSRGYDFDSPPPQPAEKQSFWKRFTLKNKSKR